MKINMKYGIAFIILFIVEAFIALFVRDTIIRPFVGDVLVVILVYAFIRIFVAKPIKLLPIYVFLFAAAVEAMQYFNIVQLLNLQDNALARVVLGTTFDVKDILCYLVGAIILMGWQQWEKRHNTIGR